VFKAAGEAETTNTGLNWLRETLNFSFRQSKKLLKSYSSLIIFICATYIIALLLYLFYGYLSRHYSGLLGP
jgi:hypothetical protein